MKIRMSQIKNDLQREKVRRSLQGAALSTASTRGLVKSVCVCLCSENHQRSQGDGAPKEEAL